MSGNIFRIQDIKIIVEDVYPAYSQFYNTYPIAMVSIRNTVSYPIEINVHSEVQGFSERPQESGFIRIGSGETKDIPVYALFGSKLMGASRREAAAVDIQVEARAGASHSKSVSRQIMIHNRNAWNGEIDKLGFFVTPDHETVLNFSRVVLQNLEDAGTSSNRSLLVARSLLNAMNETGLRYQSDPNIPFYRDDRVQFASETL